MPNNADRAEKIVQYEGEEGGRIYVVQNTHPEYAFLMAAIRVCTRLALASCAHRHQFLPLLKTKLRRVVHSGKFAWPGMHF